MRNRAALVAALSRQAALFAVSVLPLLLPISSVFAHGGYHERIEHLTAETAKNPSDPLLHFELAKLHGLHGDVHLALRNLDRVDALAPGKFMTDLLRGEAFLVASKFAKAKEVLDRQLVSHPENARALLFRARAKQKMGENQASLADYREALKRTASPDPDLVQEVADALAKRGFQKEAAEVLAAGIERLGKIPSLVLRALDLEIAMKNFDAALQRVEEMRQAAPRPEPWMARRAEVLTKADRIEEARAEWKALVKHLDSLPDRERTSNAMRRFAKEAREALKSLSANTSTLQPPAKP